MRKYSLWNSYLSNVIYQYQNYEVKNKSEQKEYGYKIIRRLIFNFLDNQGQNVLKDTFTLPELDCITASFPNEKKFKEKLTNINSDLPIVSTYIHDKKIKQIPLVYNSLLLYYAALFERKKTPLDKKNKAPVESNHPKIRMEIDKFINRLCAIAQDEKTVGYITQNKNFMETLTREEVRLLKNYMKKGGTYKTSKGYVTVYTLRDMLEAYTRIYWVREKNKKFGIGKLNDDEEIKIALEEIEHTLLKSYNDLRNAILFVQLVDKIEYRKKLEKSPLNEQIRMIFKGNEVYYNLSEETLKECTQYLIDSEENKDILKQIHLEQEKKWPEIEEDITDYGISEIEMELGEYEKGLHK